MAKTSNKSATKVDKLIGHNIRVRRLAIGLTQEQLAEKLGVTFQQVQKYEKGANRVGSGRLHEIAGLLEVPVAALFGGEDKQKKSRGSSPFDLLSDPLTMQMAKEFSKIGDRDERRAVLNLVEAMVGISEVGAPQSAASSIRRTITIMKRKVGE
jgi:transcriptional regulator with XRE-family HTH domain